MTFTESTEHPNEEISQLFKEAKDKLDKVEKESSKKKKDIVIQLAKDLEGKIPIDTISTEIVKRLSGHISQSLIHESLNEKYKQRIRVQNAKKQKKRSKDIDLAPLSALKEEDDLDANWEEVEPESQENKQVVVVGTDGQTYTQIEDDNDEKPSKSSIDDYTILKGKSIGQSLFTSQQEQEQLDELNQLADTMNKTEKETRGSFEISSNVDKDIEILPFEFSINRIDLQNYFDSVESFSDGYNEIWFNGKINTKTREVDCAFGRLNQ